MLHLEVGAGERLLFISDLHLCESRPATTAAFLAFLGDEARRCDQLFILGDLFEYWVGDDDDRPLAVTVAEALAGLHGDGVAIRFMAGNRDFLIAFSDRDPQHMAAITSQVRRDARRREHALTPELLVWQAGRIRALDPHH